MTIEHFMNRRRFCQSATVGAGLLMGGCLSGCGTLASLFYRKSLLATKWERRRKRYNFVVVGSGYGGSILAARLSSPNVSTPQSVCILERGREWPVGSFPDTDKQVLRAVRNPLVNPLGLYEFLIGKDLGVLQGCGLGGTSLINGNVAIEADYEVFDDDRWPTGVTAEALSPYYQLACNMLGVRSHPRHMEFQRVRMLERRAEQINHTTIGMPLAVNFDNDGINDYGIPQKPCLDCGDCVTGCNVGAKNTLAFNYLPLARSQGTHIFTHTEVKWIESLSNGGWLVHGKRYGLFGIPQSFVLHADSIVLSAGTIGTTEILLRSQRKGLPLSDQLGLGLTGNGDFLGIAHNSDFQTNVTGFGNHPASPWRRNAPGPSIIGGIHYNTDKPLEQRFIVQDTALPSALVKELKILFNFLPGIDTDSGDTIPELLRRHLSRIDQPYAVHNALNHTMMYLVMGHDRADGRISLDENSRVRIESDGVGRQEIFDTINEELHQHARALGAKFISNPVWSLLDFQSLLTVHPLGGCRMGDTRQDGVVDEYGRVFNVDGELHRNLFVADGSVVSTSLGLNPMLTIAALSERIANHIVMQMD